MTTLCTISNNPAIALYSILRAYSGTEKIVQFKKFYIYYTSEHRFYT